jgi:hypothetical protein
MILEIVLILLLVNIIGLLSGALCHAWFNVDRTPIIYSGRYRRYRK